MVHRKNCFHVSMDLQLPLVVERCRRITAWRGKARGRCHCVLLFEQHGPHMGFLLLIVKEVKLYHFSKIIFTYNSFCKDIYNYSRLIFFNINKQTPLAPQICVVWKKNPLNEWATGLMFLFTHSLQVELASLVITRLKTNWQWPIL